MAYKKSNPNGQSTMANSEPVVIASDQTAVPVSFTGSTDVATQTTLAAINTKLVSGTDIGDVTINNATGAAAVNIQDGGNSITVDGAVTATLSAETTKVIGTVNIAAAQTIGITANSSVNVAQINGVTPLMGAGNTGTGSQRVTIATDQVAVATKAASGSYASGCFASGSFAAGAIAAGNTSIATTEDTARAAGEHLVKVGQVRLDTLAANANVDASGDYTTFIADNNGATWVDPQGNVAHDGIDAGNPIKIGGRASTTPVTAVAANDRVDAFFDVQGRQVVTQKALTGTTTSVAGSASNVTLLAANTARLGATLYNDSTAICYVKLGATASTTSFTVKMTGDSYYEVPFGYYGIIDGIWASATGNMRITEIS